MKLGLLATLLAAIPLSSQTTEDIRGLLANGVDDAKKAVGIVVGRMDEKSSSVLSYGRFDKNDPRTPGENTVFEIGSITVEEEVIWSAAACCRQRPN